jgi:hypothetical protein
MVDLAWRFVWVSTDYEESELSDRITTVRAQWVPMALMALLALVFLFACAAPPAEPPRSEQRSRGQTAMAMFNERCKKAGEFIHRTVAGVDGILVMKVRPDVINYDQQFAMTDPYGHDFVGEAYSRSFLRGFYAQNSAGSTRAPGAAPLLVGFEYVEAVNLADGVRYRYTGRIEEPWLTNKSYLKGYLRFVADRSPPGTPPPRYGVTYEDISTREEREYWIAGSSLRIVDLVTNEIIAERIGYMFDAGQGSRGGGRSPWLFAFDHACPSFLARSKKPGPAAPLALYQTARFVEKVLQPKTP